MTGPTTNASISRWDAVLEILRGIDRPWSCNEIADELGERYSDTYNTLSQLVRLGWAKRLSGDTVPHEVVSGDGTTHLVRGRPESVVWQLMAPLLTREESVVLLLELEKGLRA